MQFLVPKKRITYNSGSPFLCHNVDELSVEATLPATTE